LWELSRLGWWKLLLAQCSVLGIAAVVYACLLRDAPLEPRAGRSLHYVLLCITFVACGGAALAMQGDPRRWYRLPLSNKSLAAVAMLPGMIVVAVMIAVTAMLLNGWFDVGWPVFGLAMFFAAMLACLQSATQLVGPTRGLRFVAWCVIAIASEAWLRARYGGGAFPLPNAMWMQMTVTDALNMLVAMAAAYAGMIHGIARDRRGDGEISWRLSTRRTLREREWPAFRSPFAAQLWCEWKQKGWVLPATFIVFAALICLFAVLGQFGNTEYELLHMCIGYGTGLGPIAIAAGLVLGHVDFPERHVECGSFRATRPMTNASLSAAVLVAEGLSLLLTWGLWIAGLAITTAVLYRDQGPAPVLDLWSDHGRYTPAMERLGMAFPVLATAIALVKG